MMFAVRYFELVEGHLVNLLQLAPHLGVLGLHLLEIKEKGVIGEILYL